MAALIMAAGQASRFGECKQLVKVNGKSLLQHSIDMAQALCPGRVFAVSGAWHCELSMSIQNEEIKDVTLIEHPAWVDGLGSSIARGVTFLADDFDSILIILADQIGLTKEDLLKLRHHFSGDNIVCGLYAGRRGVPAIFGRNSFEQLKVLQGDRGAKAILYGQHVSVVEYPLECASIDIDTWEDLDLWVRGRSKENVMELLDYV
ncbi:MAG: nucleotidyltransferase family protein [Nitrospirales bacterium]